MNKLQRFLSGTVLNTPTREIYTKLMRWCKQRDLMWEGEMPVDSKEWEYEWEDEKTCVVCEGDCLYLSTMEDEDEYEVLEDSDFKHGNTDILICKIRVIESELKKMKEILEEMEWSQ